MKRATALAMLISCGVVVAACNAIFDLGEGALAEDACAVDAECDDDNPCTADQCLQGSCTSVAVPNTVVSADEQVEGDCRRLECDAEGEVQQNVDDEDAPNDDNDCTVEECRSGEVFSEPIDIGNRCNNGNGFCDGEGNCGTCITEADCPAATFCVSFACEMGQCTPSFTPEGTPTPTDVSGNCQREVCDGAGSKSLVDDVTDVPVDGNECTDDVCSGTPLLASNPAVTDGTDCGSGASTECTGGICVGCGGDADCKPDTFCAPATCNLSNQQCEVSPTGMNTPLPGGDQTAGDCQVRVCNGAGGVSTNNDDGDPFNDGNDCTTDTCSDGAPIHTDCTIDSSCGANDDEFCDDGGQCVECNSPSQCPPGANECAYAACAANSCTMAFRPQNYVLSQQTSGDCKRAICDGNGAISSVAEPSDEPPDDGNDCTDDTCSGSTPVHPELTGPACSGGFCSSGLCVECYQDVHCGSGCCVVSSGYCITSGCSVMS